MNITDICFLNQIFQNFSGGHRSLGLTPSHLQILVRLTFLLHLELANQRFDICYGFDGCVHLLLQRSISLSQTNLIMQNICRRRIKRSQLARFVTHVVTVPVSDKSLFVSSRLHNIFIFYHLFIRDFLFLLLRATQHLRNQIN